VKEREFGRFPDSHHQPSDQMWSAHTVEVDPGVESTT
jgi:hypothetical protein